MADTTKRIPCQNILLFFAIVFSCTAIFPTVGVGETNNELKHHLETFLRISDDKPLKNKELDSRLSLFYRKYIPNPNLTPGPVAVPGPGTMTKANGNGEKDDLDIKEYYKTITMPGIGGSVGNIPIFNRNTVDKKNVAVGPCDMINKFSNTSKANFKQMNQVSRKTAKSAKIAKKNLDVYPKRENVWTKKPDSFLNPGDPAQPFSMTTLDGSLIYPSPVINTTNSVLFHAFTRDSGFVDALWHSNESLAAILLSRSKDVHYIFLSSSKTSPDAIEDAKFMKTQLSTLAKRLHSK